MKVYAISDLHINHPENRNALLSLSSHPDDWLLVAGDVAERYSDIEFAFSILVPRFKKVVWIPGNHELWTLPGSGEIERGQARYDRLVRLSRSHGVLTPEDPYAVLSFDGEQVRIAPTFVLYDYSFRPDTVACEDVAKWAAEVGSGCADEFLLHPDPYPTRAAWCRARCDVTLGRLEECNDGTPIILVNHFPLLEEFAHAPFVPRFTPWCGTRRTRGWHLRFNVKVVVSGHLHIPTTRFKDGVRFEEVSLGYPRQRDRTRPIDSFLREVWPGPRV